MTTINRDELFTQVSQFLKTKGIELQEGSYSRTIQKGCQVLADTINLSQQAVGRAKSSVEKKLDEVREVIHQKTAPKPPPVPPQATPAAAPPPSGQPQAKAARARKSPRAKTVPPTPRTRGKRAAR